MLQRNIIRCGILLLSILVLLAPVIWIENDVWRHTHGTITFPVDTAFTDMAIAQNLAFNQIWGLSKHSFGPSGSSILYIAVLAVIFFIVGAHSIIPLLVNAAASVWFLIAFWRWLNRMDVRPGYLLVILPVAIFGLSIPLWIVIGMGYPLQLLFGFRFVTGFLSAAKTPGGPIPRKVWIDGLLMVAANVEMLALLVIAGVILVRQRRWKAALKLGVVALSPVIVFAIITFTKGAFFLPHAVGGRSQIGLTNVRQACIDTYNEQYQVARFVRRYYDKWAIACNSVGPVAYYSEGRKLDLDIDRPPQLIDSLIEKDYIRVAILHDKGLDTNTLSTWNKIASWQVRARLSDKEDSVSFYAFPKDSLLKVHLLANLQEYQPRLPAEITVRYY